MSEVRNFSNHKRLYFDVTPHHCQYAALIFHQDKLYLCYPEIRTPENVSLESVAHNNMSYEEIIQEWNEACSIEERQFYPFPKDYVYESNTGMTRTERWFLPKNAYILRIGYKESGIEREGWMRWLGCADNPYGLFADRWGSYRIYITLYDDFPKRNVYISKIYGGSNGRDVVVELPFTVRRKFDEIMEKIHDDDFGVGEGFRKSEKYYFGIKDGRIQKKKYTFLYSGNSEECLQFSRWYLEDLGNDECFRAYISHERYTEKQGLYPVAQTMIQEKLNIYYSAKTDQTLWLSAKKECSYSVIYNAVDGKIKDEDIINHDKNIVEYNNGKYAYIVEDQGYAYYVIMEYKHPEMDGYVYERMIPRVEWIIKKENILKEMRKEMRCVIQSKVKNDLTHKSSKEE